MSKFCLFLLACQDVRKLYSLQYGTGGVFTVVHIPSQVLKEGVRAVQYIRFGNALFSSEQAGSLKSVV